MLARLDVPVHQPGRVGRLQCLAHRGRDRGGLTGRNRTELVEEIPQGAARGQFHHDVRRPAVDPAVEDRHDPRMAQPGHVPGLPLEPGQESRVRRVLRAEHLDRDLTVQNLVAGA